MERLRIEALVEKKLQTHGHTHRRHEDFDQVEDVSLFLAKEVRSDVQRFWKRLRKSQAKTALLRYFAALEYHKDGWPHVHALLHTDEGVYPQGFKDGFPEANTVFAKEWGHGFTQTWLVDRDDPQRAFYVAKYLSKSGGRISASQRYGQPRLEGVSILTPKVECE